MELSTEMNSTLSVLIKKAPSLRLGKYFMQKLVSSTADSVSLVTVNYTNECDLFMGVGVMFGRGHQTQAGTRSEGCYPFLTGSQEIVLRVHKAAMVTDFDEVKYDPEQRQLLYKDRPILSGLRQKFANGHCTLLFEPYSKQDSSEEWLARRKALLSYMSNRWKLLDPFGCGVVFVESESRSTQLDPKKIWLALCKEVRVAEAPCTKQEELTYKDFSREAAALLVKYQSILEQI